MSEEQTWKIVFYKDEGGDSPVEAFLDGLDKKTRARFFWSIGQLRLLSLQAREPLVKHLEGKLWELRRTSDGNIYRLLYFFHSGRLIVFVHAFQKKTDKTPRREIETAQKRMDDFVKRKGGG